MIATVITPAEAGRKPRFAWVRIEEGKDSGSNERVSYEVIEPALNRRVARRSPS